MYFYKVAIYWCPLVTFHKHICQSIKMTIYRSPIYILP